MESLWESGVAVSCFGGPEVETGARALQAKDKFWRQLSATEQQAAELLGWTQRTWDDGDPTPMETLHWAAWLKAERRAAARAATPMSEAQRAAARALGYSQSVWDHGVADNPTLVGLGNALVAAVEKEEAGLSSPREALGWNRPALRGLLDGNNTILQNNERDQLLQRARAAVQHYLQTTHGSDRRATATVKITDSWVHIGRVAEWTGAHVSAHPRDDIIGHLFVDCQARGVCSLQLNDPRARADAQTSSTCSVQYIIM